MCVQVQGCVCCIVHRENRGGDDEDEEARHESQGKQNLAPLALARTRCSWVWMPRASGDEAIVEGAKFIDWPRMLIESDLELKAPGTKSSGYAARPLALHGALVDRRGRNDAHDEPGSGRTAHGSCQLGRSEDNLFCLKDRNIIFGDAILFFLYTLVTPFEERKKTHW